MGADETKANLERVLAALTADETAAPAAAAAPETREAAPAPESPIELWYQPKIDIKQRCLAGAEALARTEAGLARAAGFLRSELGRRLKLRVTPEVRFVHDPSVERGARLSRLIDEAVAGKKDE